MDEKLYHVTCLVKQQHLHDLLGTLEICKVGNLEVRAVTIGTPALNGKGVGRGNYKRIRRTKHVTQAVREFMTKGIEHNYNDLAKEINANSKSVANAMRHLVIEGVVKKVSPGMYVRVKEDE